MYPVTYSVENAEPRNRLTTFFRYFVAIPWMLVGLVYGFAASFTILFAWFALVFTGRYPEGLYNFNAKFVQWSAMVGAFFNLETDEYPPFALGPDPDYPVQVSIPARKAQYSRAKAFFRVIVGIPVIFLGYIQIIIASVMALFGWFAILFTGRLSDGLFNPLRSALAYQTRYNAYFFLLTEDWPPFSLEDGQPHIGTIGETSQETVGA